MIIVEDTRNQITKHRLLNDTLTAKGITVVRSKLFVGDYTRLDNQTVCVDTKKDIDEIAGNICGKQHERFREECIRARDNFIRLIVLIEELPPKGDLEEAEHALAELSSRIEELEKNMKPLYKFRDWAKYGGQNG